LWNEVHNIEVNAISIGQEEIGLPPSSPVELALLLDAEPPQRQHRGRVIENDGPSVEADLVDVDIHLVAGVDLAVGGEQNLRVALVDAQLLLTRQDVLANYMLGRSTIHHPFADGGRGSAGWSDSTLLLRVV
jgi:hypothetical protein